MGDFSERPEEGQGSAFGIVTGAAVEPNGGADESALIPTWARIRRAVPGAKAFSFTWDGGLSCNPLLTTNLK